MPVQARSIPYLQARQDLMVQSRTGSGKTGAFILPALERIDVDRPKTQVLVLTPTRELARQVAREAHTLSQNTPVNAVAIYGGVPYHKQKAAFRQGAHLIVGTPGRILDHLLSGNFTLDDLQLLIFDEADRMLSVGFYPDMKALQRYMPTDRHVNTCMFSATFPPHVMRLVNEFLREPAVVSLSSDHVHVTNTEHITYRVPDMGKENVLVNIIELENPDSAIIFCNTKQKTHYVNVVLRRYGYDAEELSGDLQQRARERVLGRLRAGNLRYLVATDVAARGIDIPDLSHVIQYDVPQHPEVYIHRAGRTGRAGASGTAITLVETLELLNLAKITKQYEIDMQDAPLPHAEQLAQVVIQRVRVLLIRRLRSLDKATRMALNVYEPMVELMASDGDGIRALAMLLDDYYHRMLHAPPLASDAEESAQALTLANTAGLSPEQMAKLAEKLALALRSRDILRVERIQRFEQLVEDLAMEGAEFHILTMLLAEFDQQSKQSKPSKRKKKSKPKSRK